LNWVVCGVEPVATLVVLQLKVVAKKTLPLESVRRMMG